MPPSPHSFGATAREKSASPKIYLDLTDVVTHAIWHSTSAGIPRVQLEIAATLLRSGKNVVPYSLYNNTWRTLAPYFEQSNGDGDLLLRLFQQSVPFRGVRPSLRRPIETARLLQARLGALTERLRSRTPALTAESTVFVGGAFWISPPAMALCKRAAAVGANLVVLMHDLIPLIFPEFTGHDFSSQYREILNLPAHFIVTTEHNRAVLKNVRKDLGVRGETSASVVPLAHEFPGAARNAPPALPTARLQSLQNLDFVLCVGTVEVRKNHAMLFSIWDELAAEHGISLPPLVVAGRRGWKADAALRRLDEFFESGRIIFVEAPSDEELRWLYSACQFTIFPSFYEGWGLPVGESLWFGKPCAASDTSSIPHVGGDLCTYFSPYHATTIKDAIKALLNPDMYHAYSDRIRRAPLRTWADVASDLGSAIMQRRSDSVPDCDQRHAAKSAEIDAALPPIGLYAET
ncbi:MAG: glycosyltransferase family 1 protein [Pseudomonadota bacterium]